MIEQLNINTKAERKERYHARQGFSAHAHFVKGKLVVDSECKNCRGVPIPKKTPAELAERKRQKYQYYLDWKRKQKS
ncbi:hypothetical protein LCGC14_0417770 [marine sediment metagenome]|uniref:Uncharacterized protein n=1 Tax=marine sediment metagenome TaxID=412755 RepID=A0A0F9VDQ4_9ZZZZ